jgi:hypothetical protein
MFLGNAPTQPKPDGYGDEGFGSVFQEYPLLNTVNAASWQAPPQFNEGLPRP